MIRLAVQVLLLTLIRVVAQSHADCNSWFKDSHIKTGAGCLLKCASAPMDMASFTCAEECPVLCQGDVIEGTLFNMSFAYGLTASERALAIKSPIKAFKAYRLSHSAERLCERLYKENRTNDESDACRHFIWAALLTKDLGLQVANQILNAHEKDVRQPEQERAMDLANNRQGQIAVQTMKNPSEAEIMKAYDADLRHGNLVIIKPLPGNKKRKP